MRPLLLLAFVVVAAACGDAGGTAPTAPPATSAPPTSIAPPPTTAPENPPAATTTRAATTTTATTTTSEPPPPLLGLVLAPVAAGLHQPTAIATAPGRAALYVAEREGRVAAVTGGGAATYLDLEDRTHSAGIEQGLLGIAFHPEDADRLFVYRTVPGDARRLAEFTAADPDSERVLFELAQPGDEPRHYGGMLLFGPDGKLWVSLGDGAASRHGQDPATPYGTILRIDVDGEGEPEVWAYGLRNPWRFAIDDGLVYIADVGLERREEINVVPVAEPGHNFGWSIAEGDLCFAEAICDPGGDGLTAPVLTYGHDEGCSITGGTVYRGTAIPELAGHYFYGDWCGQWVRSFRYAGGAVADERDWSADLLEAGQVNAFGTGPDGELYVANFAGEVWRLAPRR